jgi:alkylation response protein AidB-like acyl-CoA dehydrogenase
MVSRLPYTNSKLLMDLLSQSYKQQANKLAGYIILEHPALDNLTNIYHSQIAFLKSYSTACGQETARDAVQIFGGRGITKTGMGKYIEHVRDPTCRALNILTLS